MEKLKFTKKKLKVISVFLCICLVMGLALNEVGLLQLALADDVASWDGNTNVAVNAGYKYNGGQATNATGKSPTQAYQIKTGEDLIQFAVNVNNGVYDSGDWYFQLANNITLNDNEWVPIGTEDHTFKGVFNGNNKTIMNMKLTANSNTKNRNIGFFGCVQECTITNLNIVNSNIVQSDAGAGTYVGGLAGSAYRSTITNCSFSGNVAGGEFVGGLIGSCQGSSGRTAQILNCNAQGGVVTADKQAAGGLIGDLNNGLVLNSYNKCGVTLQSSGSGKLSAGGIAGSSARSEIVNCYNTGSINSSSVAGGIANLEASTATSVINCYNAGSVSGSITGNICGSSNANCIFDNCFFQNNGIPFIPEAASANSIVNVGTFSGSGANAAISKVDSSTWSYVENETLANALANKADSLASRYSGILEWAADESGVNNYYPIHTSVSGHIHDRAGGETIIQEANCTEAGVKRIKCSQCDKTWDERIEPTKHSYETNPNQLPVIITPSTCTAKGQAKKVCTNMDRRQNPPVVCGAEMAPYDLDPLGHATQTVTHEATCVVDQYAETICLNGGCTDYPQYVTYAGTALGHDYVTSYSVATCTEPAKMEYTCTRCHDTYTLSGDTQEGKAIGLIEALGHDWDSDPDVGIYVSSTCVELGGYVCTCKRCTYSFFVNQDGEELAPHEYEKTVHDPTCTEQGYDEYLCKVCGIATYTDNYKDKLPHVYTTSVVKPTCTTEGYTRHTCINCDDYYDDDITKTIDHQDELDTENSLLPTCVDDGYWLYRCASCGRERRVKTDNGGGHNMAYSEADSVKQTCELGGYDLYVCTKCGETERRNVTQEGFGHNWSTRTLEPTCEDYGRTERFCDQCGSSSLIGDQVPPLGHNYQKEVTEATTTTRGFTTYTCTRCDDEYRSDFIAATPDGHYNVLTQMLTLTDVDDELMSWSLDAGETWNVEEVSCVAVTVEAIDLDNGIWVKRLGTRPGVQFFSEDILTCSDSAIQIIEVKRGETPSGINGQDPIVENGTGTITGLSTLMEYRMESEEEWHDVLSDTMENLSPGIYYFRYKATEDFLASEAMMVEIKDYVEATDPPTGIKTEPPVNTNPPGVTDPINTGEPGTPGNPSDPQQTLPPGATGNPNPQQTLPPGATNRPGQMQTDEPGTTGNPNSPQNPNDGSNGNNSSNGNNNGTNNGNNNGTNNGNANVNNNGTNNGGNNGVSNAGNQSDGVSKTEMPSGVIPNTVYYSSNGGAGTSTTTTTSRVAAKTADEANVAVWAVLACISCAGVAIICKKKEEE